MLNIPDVGVTGRLIWERRRALAGAGETADGLAFERVIGVRVLARSVDVGVRDGRPV